MNLADLRTELRRQAEEGPDLAALRTDIARASAAHLRRRRTTALIAAAAAVAVLVGGAGITAAALKHGTVGPAGPLTVVPVPDVPLPPGTKLIRHQLAEVTSPVDAPAPDGMDAVDWIGTPGRLEVGYGVSDHGSITVTSADEPAPTSAGYAISDTPGGTVTVAGPTAESGSDTRSVAVTSTPTTVSGHPAELQVAQQGAVDDFGFPAERRLVWQLATGEWIHVWGVSAADPDLLDSFAASIAERPTPLYRSVGIGLTLPGLTEDSSINVDPIDPSVLSAVYLCPPGSRPFDPATSRSTSEVAATPYSSCLIASVVSDPGGSFTPGQPAWAAGPGANPTTVTVGNTAVQVNDAVQMAWSHLVNGTIAMVQAPELASLSTAELAAVVSSVRLSPSVRVVSTTPQVIDGASTATAVTEVPSSAVVDPMRPAVPAVSSVPATTPRFWAPPPWTPTR